MKGKSRRGKSFQKEEIMKIEITSEVTGRKFSGENYDEVLSRCKEDDVKYRKEQEAKRIAKEAHDKEVAKAASERSKKKKELADEVEAAETKLNEAWKLLDEKNKEAREIVRKAKEQASTLVKPYEDAVNEANERKWEAIRNYNSQFGAYGVQYTDERALNEYNRFTDYINKVFNSFWNNNF